MGAPPWGDNQRASFSKEMEVCSFLDTVLSGKEETEVAIDDTTSEVLILNI